jgi:alpha-galactosidase
MKIKLFTLLSFLSLSLFGQKFENLALTPPMGWNSWNTFAFNINEKMIEEIADDMVNSGMLAAGYTYLVIDDGWIEKERDKDGNLVPDRVKFPNGIKAVADYIHSKGLKFGIYNCAGTQTCGGLPGTRGHEYQDARNYAAWGVDYIKYDWCYTAGINAKEAYTTFSNAIKTAGRPIVFSLCEWGDNKPWEWAEKVGHLWRISGDISPCYDCEDKHETWSSWGFWRIIHMRGDLRAYAGPDHWNDPDMMEIGNGMTVAEDRTHFSMWCMLAAPLMTGNDIRKMTKETAEILTNKEAIAIDQDSLGIQGFLLEVKDSVETWVKPLKNNEWAICFANRSSKAYELTFDWSKKAIQDTLFKKSVDFTKEQFAIRNVWTKANLGNTQKPLKASILTHDVLMLRLTKEGKK